MSSYKYSLRSTNTDENKKLPIYQKNELPANTDLLGRTRPVSQMPTGMEKEEESEYHLQKTMSIKHQHDDQHKTVIPIPYTQSTVVDDDQYNSMYKGSYCMPKEFLMVLPEDKEETTHDTITYKVREEKKDGSNKNDPYVAFRKRPRIVQTRKNFNNKRMRNADAVHVKKKTQVNYLNEFEREGKNCLDLYVF